MTKGFYLVSEYIDEPLFYCKLAISLSSKDDARSSLENYLTVGSKLLNTLNLKAYPGSIDCSLDSSEVYESHGHSFYVSIIPGSKSDAEGFYNLHDLVVHDPGLLPLESLRKGVGFFEYLQRVIPDCHKLFFAFEFFADPALFIAAPIPPYNFSFSVPKMQPSSRESRAATVIQRNWRNHATKL